MNAVELIRQVEAHGGSLRIEANELKVQAPTPLPDELLAELAASKPAVMIALGAAWRLPWRASSGTSALTSRRHCATCRTTDCSRS